MKYVPNEVTRVIARSALKLQKSSPKLLFAAGIAGVATSTVLACRATLKLEKTLDDVQVKVADVKNLKGSTKGYPTNEYSRDLAYVYAQGAVRIGKLYAPAVAVGSLSVAALTGSHVVLTRRNAALTAAYAAVSKAYDEYRDRVREEVGDEKELRLRHAIKLEDISEGGKKKELGPVANPNQWSSYARFFDEYSRNWVKNAEYNRLFVECQQRYLNDKLQAQGHVFLNEAYDALGIPRSSAGAVVGWVIGKDGDNYIDFGMYTAYNSPFINGDERSILLDFNVDGVIYDKI